MTLSDGPTTAVRERSVRAWAGYAMIPVALWLAWNMVQPPFVDRAPPAIAIRISPGSPEVLRRAAEDELIAGRLENARLLAEDSLSRAPFNARTLRVRGLVEAREGRLASADEMLTLAGNWSLRDDPTHSWLIEHRLRRGDYGSAFAHADTLARRREDLYPPLFRLFTLAAQTDPRSTPFLVRLLANNPPWREAYFDHLYQDSEAAPLLGALAVNLQTTQGPFTNAELGKLYTRWTNERRYAGVQEVRRRLGRPSLTPQLRNGEFDEPPTQHTPPFGWRLEPSPGINAAVMEDDFRAGNMALRVEYNGTASGVFAQQLVMLRPGTYVVKGTYRAEAPAEHGGFAWRVVCADTNTQIAWSPPGLLPLANTEWRPFEFPVTVPANNCSAQWLWVEGRPGDRRLPIAAWFDSLQILPAAASAGRSAPRQAGQ